MKDPEEIPSRYPHQLWMSTMRSTSNKKLKQHNDRSCPVLRRMDDLKLIDKDKYVYEIEICGRCGDDSVQTQNKGKTVSNLAKKLKCSDNPKEILKE
jgi:hypothetical protein